MTTSTEKFEELFRREACLVDEFPEEADLEYIMDRDDKRRRRLRAEKDHVATALAPKLESDAGDRFSKVFPGNVARRFPRGHVPYSSSGSSRYSVSVLTSMGMCPHAREVLRYKR